MKQALLTPDTRGYLTQVVRDLLWSGWLIEKIPEDGRILRNGQKLVLKAGDLELRLRIFTYKVTSSGRGRPHERRVEITTTYQSGLKPLRGFRDVVLGVDAESKKYVGVDSKRMKLGGATHNASSFFDLEGLSVKSGHLLINPRSVANSLFSGGIEIHAFFDRGRLAEYFVNQQEIHSGTYAFGRGFSGSNLKKQSFAALLGRKYEASGDTLFLKSSVKPNKRVVVERSLITAIEKQDFSKISRKKISPEQLKKIMSVCEEIGVLGEQVVLNLERKRLRGLGFEKQASKVKRVSLSSVGEGYDILSFEDDGVTKRYIEVKSTIGRGFIVDISSGEWEAAKRHRAHYYVARVTEAKDSPQIHFIKDPVGLEAKGLVSKTPTGWKMDLRLVAKS